MSTNETDVDASQPKEYELKPDGPRRVVRAGLVIEEEETVEMLPGEALDHLDVLREVGDASGGEEENDG